MKSIIWDLDDTLIYTNALFEGAREDFVCFMQGLSLFDDGIYKVINDFDIAHVRQCQGYHKECFPYALRDTYLYYCKKYHRIPILIQQEQAEDFGWQVFKKKSKMVLNAKEVLKILGEHYALFLLTKGDKEIQNRSLNQHDLERFFQKIYIFPNKGEKEYASVIKENKIDVTHSWSIGNSIKSDINPSLRCGLNCIHFNSTSWDFENALPIAPIYVVNSLTSCLEIILEQKGEMVCL